VPDVCTNAHESASGARSSIIRATSAIGGPWPRWRDAAVAVRAPIVLSLLTPPAAPAMATDVRRSIPPARRRVCHGGAPLHCHRFRAMPVAARQRRQGVQQRAPVAPAAWQENST